MQMPCDDGNPEAASQIYAQISKAGNALRSHTFPLLGLCNVMQLAGTCRAWRQLIEVTPLHELSAEIRRAVLPSGLTSSLPLFQVVKQQAQLLARLRGKHGFTPRVQPLSFTAGLLQGNAPQSTSPPVSQLGFQEILWSPCTCPEESSHWLVLNPRSRRQAPPDSVGYKNRTAGLLSESAHGKWISPQAMTPQFVRLGSRTSLIRSCSSQSRDRYPNPSRAWLMLMARACCLCSHQSPSLGASLNSSVCAARKDPTSTYCARFRNLRLIWKISTCLQCIQWRTAVPAQLPRAALPKVCAGDTKGEQHQPATGQQTTFPERIIRQHSSIAPGTR